MACIYEEHHTVDFTVYFFFFRFCESLKIAYTSHTKSSLVTPLLLSRVCIKNLKNRTLTFTFLYFYNVRVS